MGLSLYAHCVRQDVKWQRAKWQWQGVKQRAERDRNGFVVYPMDLAAPFERV